MHAKPWLNYAELNAGLWRRRVLGRDRRDELKLQD